MYILETSVFSVLLTFLATACWTNCDHCMPLVCPIGTDRIVLQLLLIDSLEYRYYNMASKSKVRVAIIGAGFAGLGAARKLLSHEKFDVQVIEAASKVGGRMKTVRVSGGPTVELGCTFFYYYHNTSTSLTDVVKEKGFVARIVDGCSDDIAEADMPAYRVLSNGEKLPRDQVDYYQKMYFKIRDELSRRAATGNWEYVIDSHWEKGEAIDLREVAYEEYIARRFQSLLQPEHADSTSLEPKLIIEHLNRYEAYMSGKTGSENIDLLTECVCYLEPDGQIILNCSYQDVADALAKDVPSKCLQLNKEVQVIHWTPYISTAAESSTSASDASAPVTIVCTDGSNYCADHVIVTVSLGVLQQRCCSSDSFPFFSPQLPGEKLSSIAKLGMGKCARVLITFSSPLIAEPHRSIELYWLEKDYGYPEKYPWASRQFIIARKGNSSTYIARFTGDDAVAVENTNSTELAEGICLVLEKFLQKPIDRPIVVEKSTWCTDRLFLGTYSHHLKGSSTRDRDVLSQPLHGSMPLQVLFAGEASHPTLYSTTHGAYNTGIREADRLIDFYAD